MHPNVMDGSAPVTRYSCWNAASELEACSPKVRAKGWMAVFFYLDLQRPFPCHCFCAFQPLLPVLSTRQLPFGRVFIENSDHNHALP